MANQSSTIVYTSENTFICNRNQFLGARMAVVYSGIEYLHMKWKPVLRSTNGCGVQYTRENNFISDENQFWGSPMGVVYSTQERIPSFKIETSP